MLRLVGSRQGPQHDHLPRRVADIVGLVAGQSALIAWSLLVLVPFVLIFMLSLRSNMGIFTHPLSFAGPYDFELQPGMVRPPGRRGDGRLLPQHRLRGDGDRARLSEHRVLCAYFGTRLRPKAQRRLLRSSLSLQSYRSC